MKIKSILAGIILIVFCASCAGRLPKAKTAENVIDSYFHKYGRKYKVSDIGQHRVDEVKVIEVKEIHKHLVAVTAELKLHEGPNVMSRCVLERKNFYWRVVSWEKL